MFTRVFHFLLLTLFTGAAFGFSSSEATLHEASQAMCGIAGYLQMRGSTPKEWLLDRFNDLMSHRGPDGSGVETDGPVGLAHTRLSVLDLTDAARQPMWDEGHRACVVFNGEIYNFRQLREELLAAGWTFHSSGDTEVLLKACLHWGVAAAAERLNGMFAFALWHRDSRKLWLARDRLGIKPLAYSVTRDGFYFGSEFKVLLEVETPAPDLVNLLNVLRGGAPFGGRTTMFAGVLSLEPGEWACVSVDGDLQRGRYFDLVAQVSPEYYRELDACSGDEIAQRLEALLVGSVDLHMVSDAPVASLASGGLDSSVISTLASRFDPRLRLYHADVLGPRSEREAAQRLADHLGLNLVAEPMCGEQYVDWLPRVIEHNEVPSGYHPNDVPFYLVSRAAARDRFKVLLTGEGADELFHGYESMIVSMGLRTTRALLRSGSAGLQRVPGMSKVLMMFPDLGDHSPSVLTRGTDWLLQERAIEAYEFIPKRASRDVMVDGMLHCNTHLLSLLHRNDRMGMMAGIESRIPFLENEVIRFALNLPARFKVPRHPLQPSWQHPLKNNKWALRQVARNLLPESLSARRKMGFPVSPLDYLTYSASFFEKGFLVETLRIQQPAWEALWAQASPDFRWNAFSTELWGRRFFQRRSVEELTAQIATGLRPARATHPAARELA